MAPASMPPESTVVEVTPFALLYDLQDGLGIPSSEDFGMAIDITMGYLNTYMSLQYEGQGLTDFEGKSIKSLTKGSAADFGDSEEDKKRFM